MPRRGMAGAGPAMYLGTNYHKPGKAGVVSSQLRSEGKEKMFFSLSFTSLSPAYIASCI